MHFSQLIIILSSLVEFSDNGSTRKGRAATRFEQCVVAVVDASEDRAEGGVERAYRTLVVVLVVKTVEQVHGVVGAQVERPAQAEDLLLLPPARPVHCVRLRVQQVRTHLQE